MSFGVFCLTVPDSRLSVRQRMKCLGSFIKSGLCLTDSGATGDTIKEEMEASVAGSGVGRRGEDKKTRLTCGT